MHTVIDAKHIHKCSQLRGWLEYSAEVSERDIRVGFAIELSSTRRPGTRFTSLWSFVDVPFSIVSVHTPITELLTTVGQKRNWPSTSIRTLQDTFQKVHFQHPITAGFLGLDPR